MQGRAVTIVRSDVACRRSQKRQKPAQDVDLGSTGGHNEFAFARRKCNHEALESPSRDAVLAGSCGSATTRSACARRRKLVLRAVPCQRRNMGWPRAASATPTQHAALTCFTVPGSHDCEPQRYQQRVAARRTARQSGRGRLHRRFCFYFYMGISLIFKTRVSTRVTAKSPTIIPVLVRDSPGFGSIYDMFVFSL